MRIIKTRTLFEEEVEAINDLQELVCEHDNYENQIQFSNELNFDLDIPPYILAFDEERLVGFMFIFMPEKESPEVNAIVHPEYRMQGIFKKMLKLALNIFRRMDVYQCLIVVNNSSKSGMNAITHYSVSLHHKERRLFCDVKTEYKYKLTIEKCIQENSLIFQTIEKKIFGEDGNFISSLLDNPNRFGYIGFLNNEPVGVVSVFHRKSGDGSWIYGLGVLEEHRRKGYGTELLKYVKNEGIERNGLVFLDVDEVNDEALQIYYREGFTEEFCINYYMYKFK